MRLLLALLFAVGPATAQDVEGIHCYGRLLPDNKICDGVVDCSESFPGMIPNFVPPDEDPNICAPGVLRTKTLELRSENLANRSLRFTWTWHNDESLRTYLAGYYFRANSTEGTFRETLPSGRLDYTPHQLRGYTTYDILLRPFYSMYSRNRWRSSYRKSEGALGKAAILTVRTPALAPGVPKKIVPLPPMVDQPNRWGELALAVTGPEAWNSKPLGFHLRWEPTAEGQTAGRGFTFPYLASGTTPTSYNLNVTLSLSPGQEYTVFASARGLGDYGEVLVGPETSVKIETSNMAPKYLLENTVQLASQTFPNGSLIFSWTWSKGSKPAELGGFHFRTVSAVHTFQTTLSKDDTHFFPALLRPYTEYEIMLKPFYVLNGSVIDTEKLGKPARISMRTPAGAPGSPTALMVLPTNATSKPSGHLPLAILEPVAWNSKPQGFHLRWEPAEEEGQAGMDIAIPAMAAANETKTKHDVDATLMLKPGREYIVFASARGLGDNGEVHVGPETPMKVEITPLAPVDFTAELVDPSKVILTWSAASPARSFQVTVTDCRRSEHECNNENDEKTLQLEPSHSASPAVDGNQAMCNLIGDPTGLPVDMFVVRSIPKEAAGTLTDLNTDISIDGSALPSSSYSLPVFGLTPSREYAARVKACARDTCSDEVGTVFQTPPSVIPVPEVTKVLSNDSKSIYLEWKCPFMEQLLELSPEFQVRVRAPGFFRIVSTAEKALAIGNLSNGTSFEVEVRMSLEVAPGKRKYGGPAKATISTWSDVPLAPRLKTEGFETAPDVVALSWTFVNSTVTHLQFAANSTDFVNCESSNDCAVVVLRGWNSSFKAGFVKISRLSPYKEYDIALRGCNAHGCGDATIVRVATAISEPGAPDDLKLSGKILAWSPPTNAAGPLSGYWIFWSCDNGPTTSASTKYPGFHVPGLPSEAEECTFSVSAYNVLEHGEELHGDPATLTTPLPVQS